MNRTPLDANERTILGKKVKSLRLEGLIPAHVFGNKLEVEHVSVNARDFLKVYSQTGESGLIDLKIGAEKIRPVLVRDVQLHAVTEAPLHIDFYQVNLSEKVKVSVPIILIGEELELVHTGAAVVIQPMSEVEVEALPTELPENIEVNTSILKEIGDVITVAQLQIPQGVEVIAEPEAVVVKLDTAVTEEMQKLLEEQEAEQAAAAEAAAPAEGETEAGAEGEGESQAATDEGKEKTDGEAAEPKPEE